ncbi:MAG: prolyl oligopeptidase family serine peptidase [Planctomycetota bacterium]
MKTTIGVKVVAACAALASGAVFAGERFDPANFGEHVTVRVGYAVKTKDRVKIDGATNERIWDNTSPLGVMRSDGASGAAPIRLPEGWRRNFAQDPTFVRAAFDDKNLYFAITAMTAPRPDGSKMEPIEKDEVMFRFDPFARGRHAMELFFSVKGLVRVYDSHETWGYDGAPATVCAGGVLAGEKPDGLGREEAAAWASLGKGASGWRTEIAIPWKELANSGTPGEGDVWGLQVSRTSAAGEESSWSRNTFNRFDPQGHVSFVSRLPDTAVVALTFGHTVPAMTPWSVYLENRSDKPAGALVRLACRARGDNEEFQFAHLEPGEARRLVCWLPFGEGMNRVEVQALDDARKAIYRMSVPALVNRSDADQAVDLAGGYARMTMEQQLANAGEEMAVSLLWENDVRGRSPLGDAAAPELLFYFLPDGAGGDVSPLAVSGDKAEPLNPAWPYKGGRMKFNVRLPQQAPQGFARVLAVPTARLTNAAARRMFKSGAAVPAAELAGLERHADLSLAAPCYVRGAALAEFAGLVAEARKTFEAADGQTVEQAVKNFWKPETIRFPQGQDPQKFSAIFGAKMSVRKAEAILKDAEKKCSILVNAPLFETDLRGRLAAFAAGKAPDRGILWKAYLSKLDDMWQPYCLYVPEGYDGSSVLPLIVDLHGYGGGWEYTSESGRVIGARAEGCLLLKPYLRGRNWYVGWGDRELVDLLDVVLADYKVDPDRIYISGFSMGGCGTMKFIATYPDIFVAGAGSSGRAEPLQGERTGLTPSWIADGYKDQGTPWTGGRMFQLHAAESEPVAARHRGDAFGGHGYWQDSREIFSWLLAQPMNRWPKRFAFTVYSARLASLRWVKQIEPARYGDSARVTAEVLGQRVELLTENVAGVRLALSDKLLDTAKPVEVVWNGKTSAHAAGAAELRLGTLFDPPAPGRKNPGELAGPLDDFITRRFVIIQGTLADPKASADAVEMFLDYWEEHFQGRPQVVLDTAVDGKKLADSHLLCIGTEATNDFLRRHAGRLPIRADGDVLTVGNRKIRGGDVRFWYLATSPLNAERYLLVAGALKAERIADGLMKVRFMPGRFWDYAVYGGDGGRAKSPTVEKFAKSHGLTAFGWFDRDWKVYRDAPLLPDSVFMDNLDESQVLTPEGEWRPGAGPRR